MYLRDFSIQRNFCILTIPNKKYLVHTQKLNDMYFLND